METVGRQGNKNCVRLLTLMALVSALAVMFSAAACGQGLAAMSLIWEESAAAESAKDVDCRGRWY